MKAITTKIEAAADPKDIREYLRQPILDTDRELVYASNGNIIAAVPVDLDPDDHAGPIPAEALQRARKSSRKAHADCLKLNGRIEFADGSTSPRPDIPTESIIKSVRALLDGTAAREARQPDLVIDAALLIRLADALHDATGKKTRGLRLWLARTTDDEGNERIDITQPIRVKPWGDDSGAGIIAPMRL